MTKQRLNIRFMAKTRGEKNRKVEILIPKFTLDSGEFVAVVGSNGSGKSTLLDMLGLILSPDRSRAFEINGEASIDPCCLSPYEKINIRRRHFAYVLQTGGLLEFLTIRENIRLAARLKGMPDKTIQETARKLGIQDILNKRPGKVSGGQRQKAAIARALVQEPNIILADEPTSAMDTHSASRLMKTFQTLTQKSGAGLIMVTHDLELAKSNADRFYEFQVHETNGGRVSSVLTQIKKEQSL